MAVDLKLLSEHLQKQSDDAVYLNFDEIEQIIQQPLPDEAKTSYHWWDNNIHNPQSSAWLSSNYRTVDTYKMVYNKYVHFEKIPSTIRNSILYKKKARRFFWALLTIIIAPFLLWYVTYIITENINVQEKIQIIETRLSLHETQEIEDTVHSITPYLESHKEYIKLCKYYNALLENQFKTFDKKTYDESSMDSNSIIELAKRCLSYAKQAESAYYKIVFYNTLGDIYFSLYKKTLNTAYAKNALISYGNGETIYRNTGDAPLLPQLKDLKTKEDVDTSLCGLQSIIGSYEVNSTLLGNGEYLFYDLYAFANRIWLTEDKQVNTKMFEGHFMQAFISSSLSSFVLNDILNHADTSFREYIIGHPTIHQQLTIRGRYFALMFMISKKYNVNILQNYISMDGLFQILGDYNIYFINNKENQFKQDYEFNKIQYDDITAINELLENVLDTAKKYNLYDILYSTYYTLAQVNYMDYNHDNNQVSYNRYIKYRDLFSTLDKENNIAIYSFDQYLTTITDSELLSAYIEEMEKIMATISYKTNPCYYAYNARDLARHYLLDASNVFIMDESKEKSDVVLSKLESAKKYYDLSLIYFTPEKNQQMYQNIQLELIELALLEEAISIK